MLLEETFNLAYRWNGAVAIGCGVVGGVLVKVTKSKIIPFDVAIGVLIVLAMVVSKKWNENYGDETQSVKEVFEQALSVIRKDRKVLLLGIVQSAFESAMYIFTFIWTPALQGAFDLRGDYVEKEIPHGIVFATFMAATMIGSVILQYCEKRNNNSNNNNNGLESTNLHLEMIIRHVCSAGIIIFGLTNLYRHHLWILYSSFLAFEVICGIYFPAMAAMRTPYIPEEQRSAVLTFFRIPLNLVVVLVLKEELELKKVLELCMMLMGVAMLAQYQFIRIVTTEEEDGKKEMKKKVVEMVENGVRNGDNRV